MLLDTLSVSLLGSLLAGNEVISMSQGRGVNRADDGPIQPGKGTISMGQKF